jgi:hypothetical protein
MTVILTLVFATLFFGALAVYLSLWYLQTIVVRRND